MKKLNKKKVICTVVTLVVMLFSITVLSKVTTNPESHAKTIKELDEKKSTVLKLTAASTAAATAIAAVPGDATTPIANKLADLTSYFVVILTVVFLEKYLVTLTGYAAFMVLIPIAGILFLMGLWFDRTVLKVLAAKFAVFGLLIFFVIPASVKVSNMIEDTYKVSMETTVKEAQDTTDAIEEGKDSDGNFLEKAWDKIAGGVSGLVEKGETLLNNFIESIAVMLVTSCVIPIVVLLFAFWMVKLLFGIEIKVPDGEQMKKLAHRRSGKHTIASHEKNQE